MKRIHIYHSLYLQFQNQKIAQQHTGSNFKPLLTLLERRRRSQEWGQDGWFCTHLLWFFQSLYFLFSTTHHFVALQQLQQPPCIWVQQARWSQHSPQYLLAFCSKQGKNDRIWQIHTYSTRPHDSIPFATFKVAVIVSLSNVNSISLFNFVFAPRHCTTSFFTWLEVYCKTQALILMRCVTRLWNGLVKTVAFWVCISPQ